VPSGPVTQSSALETILTFLLERKRRYSRHGRCAVVGLEALFAVPIAETSMNSARLFGLTLVAGHVDSIWIYALA